MQIQTRLSSNKNATKKIHPIERKGTQKTNIENSSLRLNEIPSIAFSGWFTPSNSNKLAQVGLNLNKKGFTFNETEVFNNFTKEIEKALLAHKKEGTKGSIEIYNKDGDKIIGADLNFEEYKNTSNRATYLVINNLKKDKKEYSSAGGKIIDLAAKISLNEGLGGRIALVARNAFDKDIGDPFMFYHKMGLTTKNFKNEPPFKPLSSMFQRLDEQDKTIRDLALKTFDAESLHTELEINDKEIVRLYNEISRATGKPLNKIDLGFDQRMYLH